MLHGADSPLLGSTERSRVRDLHELYDSHIDETYRHVYARCGDREIAEDIVQDVFLTVAKSDVDPRSVTIGWLKTVARNKLIDLLRRRENYQKKLLLLDDRMVIDDLSDALANKALVVDALSELLPIHRATLMFHYVDGLTVSEIARELGRSTKGAEALITRARAALRKELEDLDV